MVFPKGAADVAKTFEFRHIGVFKFEENASSVHNLQHGFVRFGSYFSTVAVGEDIEP